MYLKTEEIGLHQRKSLCTVDCEFELFSSIIVIWKWLPKKDPKDQFVVCLILVECCSVKIHSVRVAKHMAGIFHATVCHFVSLGY